MILRWLLPLLLLPIISVAQDPSSQLPAELVSNERPSENQGAEPPVPPFQSGILALKSEHRQDAITSFTRELANHPNNGKAWYYRGVCHAGLGNTQAALADFDRALELMPNDANALLRRSEVHLELGSYEAVQADLSTVLTAHPTGPVAEHALMSLGEMHMRRGDHAKAIATYDRFVTIAPDDARSWFNRGIAHAHGNDHQQAYNDLTRAISLDGWMYKAFASRAIELVHLDRKPEACADLIKARELGDTGVDDLQAIYCD